ncbi:SAM-dependent methyltransferase [Geovibrio thiophilus]|uniref:SAM-dependent methyltransferase n=1 Tax=Geovibrio thiophilus TaxID=139438 RepID=A0A3R5XYA8_9BACT|nr:methyltransferase [Geovibrio thiophilus]QAR33714.1 SAM-dependent methyltransferase [Geovibrio thiophilus]
MNKTYDSIVRRDIVICQPKEGFRFSVDAVMLADFVKPSSKAKTIDIGSGSGVIAALLAKVKGCTDIDALELQENMFSCLTETVEINGLEDIVKPVQGDLRIYRPDFHYDAAVCNPPYRKESSGKIPPTLTERTARFNETMTLDDLFGFCKSFLKSGGSLSICIDSDLLADVFVTARKNRLEPKRMRLVHPDGQTVARTALIEFRRDGRAELVTEPPLIMRINGEYTEEMRRITGAL